MLRADFPTSSSTEPVDRPAASPPPIAEPNAAINTPAGRRTKASLAKFSAIAKVGTPQEFAGFLAHEMAKWADIVKLAGAKID